MGEISFVVDPEAIDPDLVNGWIKELYSLPNVSDFLKNPVDEKIIVTDNPYSSKLSAANRKEILENILPTKEKEAIAGKTQIKSSPHMIWMNPVHHKVT